MPQDCQPVEASGIHLCKVETDLFYRDGTALAGFGRNQIKQCRILYPTAYYILIYPSPRELGMYFAFRTCAIYLPKDDVFILEAVIPQTLWDEADCMILSPTPSAPSLYPVVVAMSYSLRSKSPTIHLVVLCDFTVEHYPVCRIRKCTRYSPLAMMNF